MCILFVSTIPKPKPGGYRLILASNRDEYYARPAEPASLCAKTKIIAGKDQEPTREGGMWLGVSMKQTNSFKLRVGALLNIPGEEKKETSKYRGPIVKEFLEGEMSTQDYLEYLNASGEYRPHNLVTIEISDNDALIHHNCSIPYEGLTSFSGKQVLGFGNCTVEMPTLKVQKGRERFASIIEEYNNVEKKDVLIDELLNLLKWDQRHLPDPELKRRNPHAFKELSSVFVKFLQAGYGTRAHSIVLVDEDWNVEFIETTMEEPITPDAPKWNTKVIKTKL